MIQVGPFKTDEKGLLVLAFLAVVGVWYIKREVGKAAGAVADAVSGGADAIWEGITFDPESMGPYATLTEGAQLSLEQYRALGYMDDNGRLTPAGEEYIERQRQLMGMDG